MASEKNNEFNILNKQKNNSMKNKVEAAKNKETNAIKNVKRLTFKIDKQIKNGTCDTNSRQKKKNEAYYEGLVISFENVPKYDQFEFNKQKFGIIEADFDETLYTTKLDKNSEFYKKHVEYAKNIEKQILKNKKDKNTADNGEDQYSCIVKRDKSNKHNEH